MHRLRDNNPKEHFARALAELPCGARGTIIAHGLPDLKTLTELPPAQNRIVTKADSWDLQNPSKIQHRNRTTAVRIEESTLGSSFCFTLEEKTDCPRVHEFPSALRGHHTAPSRGGIPASKTRATGELSPDKWIRTCPIMRPYIQVNRFHVYTNVLLVITLSEDSFDETIHCGGFDSFRAGNLASV
jgi:hypothetical protein